MKKIVLLCDSFPSAVGENFLAEEINSVEYTLEVFPYNNNYEDNCYDYDKERVICHKRVRAANGKMKKSFWVFKSIFNKEIYKEIFFLLRNKKLSFYKVKEMIYFYYDAIEYIKWINKFLKKEDDIVFYSYWLYVQAFAATKLKKERKNSLAISRCHGFDLYENRHMEDYIPFRRQVLLELDKICPVSEQGKSYLEKECGYLNMGKIYVSNLGVGDWIHKFSYKKQMHKLTILTCSSLIPLKRINRLIETLLEISDIEIYWYHVGNGPLLNEYEKKCNGLSSNIHVRFLGQLNQQEIMKIYKDNMIDVFINISETEGKPVSIMEACSCFKPVIATDVGGVSEIVYNGYNGYLIPQNFENKELKSLLYRFYYMNQEEYSIMCENSKKIWQKLYNKINNYSEFYNEILLGKEA